MIPEWWFPFQAFFITVTAGFSLVAICISQWGWWRGRNIYDIEHAVYHKQRGKEFDGNFNGKLREKLQTGKYTILSMDDDKVGHIIMVLGKIKK